MFVQVRAVIDRVEGTMAILLLEPLGSSVNWPVRALPEGYREGDVLQLTLAIDEAATAHAKNAANQALQELLNRDNV